jgi:hypothetical protein
MKKKIDIYEVIMDHLFKAIVYIAKNLVKFTFKQVLSTFKHSLKFKKILNTKTKKVIYFLSIIITCLLIWVYKLHPVLYFISPFTFFSCYGFVQDLKEHRENTRIKLLNNKYKKLREIYDNKINVLNVGKDSVLLFSSELSEKEIIAKHSRLELFFNRKIAEIRQQEKNLRIYKIIFFVTKTKFKDKYYLEQYIEYADIKKKILPFVLGIDEKEKMYIEDLSKLNHVFISGESDMGKSVLLNCIIQSLLVFSNNLEMILVDLKEGIEMYDYSKFPNCLIISNMTELYKIIEYLEKEMIKRLNKIKLTPGCKNIIQYNKNNSEKMHFIVMVVDEFATIKISNGEGKILENSILSLLQKGRAAGIYLIGATQRPSGQQINTDVRAGFLWNISLRVKTPETQRMTKILGTENLKVGEFKTDIVKDTTLKSFFIDENTNNGVFENLAHKLIHKKEFIQIKEKTQKKLSFYKRLCLFIDIKIYKSYPIELSEGIDYRQLIKTPKHEIVTEIEAIKELYEIDQNNPHMDILEKTDNYKNYTDFIFVNSKDNGLLPDSKEIEQRLRISKHERLKLQNRASNEGLIEKAAKTRFRIVGKE